MSKRLLLVGAFLLAASPLAFSDRVITIDGRQLTVNKARAEGEGYRLEFPHGTITLQDGSLVKAVEIEGDMSDYVPKDDRERDFLEKGFVRYHGKWMSKRGYETELAKEAKASTEAADEAAAYSEWKNALEIETKYFRLRSNTSPELIEYYGRLLDAYYKLMNKRVGISPTPTMRGLKLRVNIYKSREEFTKRTGMAPGVAGFFMPQGKTSNLNFYHDYPDPSTSQWIALHECTHLLTFLIDQQFRPQIWINEAVADYFGSADITEDKRGKLTITPGKLQTDRVLTVQQAIKDDKAIHLKNLFNLEKSEFQAFQYAHAWSFVYFLNNGNKGKYAKGFTKFFKDLYTLKGVVSENVASYGQTGMGKQVKPDDIRDLLLKKIKVKDLDKLETEWLAFIAAIPISAPEARLKRGMRASMMGDFDAALEDLDAAIEGGISDARAFASRAAALSYSGNTEKALGDIERAIELDPLNAEYRFDRSHFLLDMPSFYNMQQMRSMLIEKDNIGVAREAAGLAADLDPMNKFYATWVETIAE